MVNKPFSRATKGAPVEMKKAGVPLATIGAQLSISGRTLRRLLKAVKENQGEMPSHQVVGHQDERQVPQGPGGVDA